MDRFLGNDWALPLLDNRNRAWFTRGDLMIQRCEACGHWQHPPEDVCGRCQGTSLAFQKCGETGHIESFVVVHRAVHPKLEPAVPYAVALVSLDQAPGVRVLGNVRNRSADALAIGDPVRAVYEIVPDPDGETLRIPQWEVVSPAGESARTGEPSDV